MFTLEKEANETIHLHKFSILTNKVTNYYIDYYKANNTVFLFPDTLEERAHARARKEVRELYLTNKAKYEELYQKAWFEKCLNLNQG